MGSWPDIDQLEEARREGRGKGVRIAILDTGVDQTHPELQSASFHSAHAVRVEGDRLRCEVCDPGDTYGHGTAIAGIIHALAPDAELQSIRVLDQAKRQHRHEVIKAGALFALQQGATILHCSFGRPGSAFTLPIYKSWTDAAFKADCHVVAASSNDDPDAPHWPAALAQVLSVTSAQLPADQLRFRSGSLVSFAAAGIDVPVLAPGSGHAVLTGSSFAAARLTGTLARLLCRHPSLTPSFALEALRRIATRDASGGTD